AQIGEGLGFGNVITFGSALRNRFFGAGTTSSPLRRSSTKMLPVFVWGIDDRYGFAQIGEGLGFGNVITFGSALRNRFFGAGTTSSPL
ncbi:hypothetical protein CP991_29635, partial [Escherichia coli]